MELSNFKSFSKFANENQSAHLIGPFSNFTGVVGPNGVGKSNVFDAIAFALNLSLAPGKVRHARELAHRLNVISQSDPDKTVDVTKRSIEASAIKEPTE
jgi:structural maintenance of chromosome 1